MGFFDGRRNGNVFFGKMIEQAACAVEAVRAVESCLDRVDEAAVQSVAQVAARSARIRSALVAELHETFITPLDREDIFNLSHAYDDMAKYALATIEEMRMLGVAADPPIRGMLAGVREEAQALEAAIRELAKNPRAAGGRAHEVHAKEGDVERIYRAAIRDLFAHASDPQALPAIFYRREVYRHISNMSDRADAAATVLGMIVM
jgi:uncharacterized protein Yka (UPF0111/DUF47 family)